MVYQLKQARAPEHSRAAEDSRSTDIQVKRYLFWLLDQDKRDWQENVTETQVYAQQARSVVELKNQEIQTFAPFHQRYSAFYTLTRSQIVTIVLFGLIILLCLFSDWKDTTGVLIALVTFVYLVHLILDVLLVARALHEQESQDISDTVIRFLNDVPWPPYTILCPLYHETRVVPQFVAAMKAMDYPLARLQILFLTEEDDLETRATIRAMGLPAHFKIVTVPAGEPRTKPRACNYGLTEATGYYTVIYDAEDKPDPLQLKKAVLTFAKYDESLACVQARLNFYNPRQNLLTRWFTAEYSQWFDMMLLGLQKTQLVIPLGGTSNHFVTQTLRALAGWDAFNVTEDCDLGLRLAQFGLKTAILHSTTYEEANSQVKNWIRQRSRWIKGYMQTYLVHVRNTMLNVRKRRWRELFSLQVVIGGKTAVLLINPLMWIMTILYLIFRPAIYNDLFPVFVLYISLFSFVTGNFFYAYTYMVSCARRKQYDLIPWMLLLPIYWLLNSIAAYMALYELIVRPHYWQKTEHGLHLRDKESIEISDLQLQEELQLTVQTTSKSQRGMLPVQKPISLKLIPSISVEDALHIMVVRRKSALLPSELVELESNAIEADFWLKMTRWTAIFISVLARGFFFFLQKNFTYPDSVAQQRLVRYIVKGTTPALITYMGGNWLPLSYYSLIPLFWLESVWKTEVASSVFAMISFIGCAIGIFLIGRRLSHNSLASFLGTLVFLLNPDILYLQSMSLPIMISLLALVVSGYYLLIWAQTEDLGHLIKVGIGTLLATLLTYEGWVMAMLLLITVFSVSFYKRNTYHQIVSNLMIYGTLGFLGIVTLLVWQWTVIGDPLFFLHVLGSYPGLSLDEVVASLPVYGLLLMNHVGLPLCFIALPGIALLVARYHTWPSLLSILLLLVMPWFCFLVAIYLGRLDPFTRSTPTLALQGQIVRADLGALLAVIVSILLIIESAYILEKIKAPVLKQAACVVLILIILGQSIWLGTHGLLLQNPGPQQLPQTYLRPSCCEGVQERDGGGKMLLFAAPPS